MSSKCVFLAVDRDLAEGRVQICGLLLFIIEERITFFIILWDPRLLFLSHFGGRGQMGGRAVAMPGIFSHTW